jgi:hypothetical protein
MATQINSIYHKLLRARGLTGPQARTERLSLLANVRDMLTRDEMRWLVGRCSAAIGKFETGNDDMGRAELGDLIVTIETCNRGVQVPFLT